MDGKRLGKAIIDGPVTEIRALLDRGSNCVVHMLWEGDILQCAVSKKDACCCGDSGPHIQRD